MSFRLRNPRNIIFVVVFLAICWITYWFCHIPSRHEIVIEVTEPTIGYEFVERVTPGNLSFKHLRKDLLKSSEGVIENDQLEENDLEYADFSERKERLYHSLSTLSKHVEQHIEKKVHRFNDSILMTNRKSGITLYQSTPSVKSQRMRNIIDYYDEENKKTIISNKPYILIHNDAASVVNSEKDVPLPLPTYIPEHHYIFRSEKFPKELNFRPCLSNGFIGTAAHSPNVYLSGFYNGKNASCHQAAIPSTASFNISGTEPAINYTRQYSLDVSTGIYSEKSESRFHAFVQRIYAHRTLTNLLVTEVDYIKKTKDAKHITLKIDLNKWHDNQDFTFSIENPKYKEVSYKVGLLNSPEYNQSSSRRIHLIYDHIPAELKPPSSHLRCKWVFLSAYGFSQEEVESHYSKGMKLLVARDDLFVEHVKGWSDLWRNGRIDVYGDDELAPALYAGMYSLLSSIPLHSNHFFGIGSSGLSFGNETNPFVDRIKVDQEMFVFPALLLTHVRLAKNILKSRNLTSEGAYANARRGGFNGLAFPYEGASLGEDMNPEKSGVDTPHVTAAILQAIKIYLEATKDVLFVNEYLSNIVFDAADFLHSRLSREGETFHVLRQWSPDESLGMVNDSFSGNAFIARALELPSKLDPNQTKFILWKEDASKIHLPKVKSTLYASHANYLSKSKVGEADVLMMNFPLTMEIPRDALSQNINHYEKALSPGASPMSKALLGINWLDVGRKARGDLYLRNLLPHFSYPFMTWNSYYHHGVTIPNHLAAMGGVLQMITYGYGGFRIKDDRLLFNPTIPLNCTSIHYVGIDYLGNSMNLVVHPQQIGVMLTMVRSGLKPDELHLLEYENNAIHKLELRVQLTIKKGMVAIFLGSVHS